LVQIPPGTTFSCNHNHQLIIENTGGLLINGGTLSTNNFSIQNDGIFQINSGTATLGSEPGNSLLTRSSGTFIMNGGIVNVAGRFQVSGGDAEISAGTLNINTVGHNSSTIASFDLSSTANFNMTGGNIVFIIPNGTGNSDISIIDGSGGSKSITGGELIFGTSSTSLGSTFKINSPTDFHDLSFYSGKNIQIFAESDIIISNQLDLKDGIFDGKTNNKTVTITNAATNAISRTSGYIKGRLQQAIATGSHNYPFPVGTDSGYTPVNMSLSGVSSTGYITVNSIENKGNLPSGLSSGKFLNRHWNITSAGIGNFTATANFSYFPEDLQGGATPASLKLYRIDPDTNVSYPDFTVGSNTLIALDMGILGEFGAADCEDIIITANTLTNVSCYGENDGAISIDISGGTSPYTYFWTTSDGSIPAGQETNKDITGLTAGTYTINVTDDADCPGTNSFTVSEPDPLIASESHTDILCNEGSSTVTISATGGTPPYSGTGDFTRTAGTYTFTVTDDNGCTDDVTLTITEPPALSFSTPTITDVTCEGDSDGEIIISASGGTGNITYSISPLTGTQNPAGTFTGLTAQTYTITATDENGCILSTDVTVSTMPDNEAPVISGCPTNITQNNDAGECSAVVTWTEPTASDNCTDPGDLTCDKSHTPGSTFPVGTTTVTYTATDEAGNESDVCSFTVTVEDNEVPLISGCPTNITQNNDAGECGAVVTWNEPSASDNCTNMGNLTWDKSHTPGSTFPVGTTTVTYTATDEAGNESAICSFTVTVDDNEDPVISGCPANITQNNDAGECSAVVTWTEPTASDNCTDPGDLTWNKSHNPGSTFPVGTTTVTYTATDEAGNESAVCSFTVTVDDNEAPTVANCPSDINTNTDAGICSAVVNYSMPTFNDNCDGVGLTGTLVSGLDSGQPFPIGTTTVTYNYTDAAGNNPTECSFNVTVTDNENPTITCQGDINRSTNQNFCYASISSSDLAPADFDDNCSVDESNISWEITGSTNNSGSGFMPATQFNQGTTEVKYTITDEEGLIATCSFDVIVTDNQKPIINCPTVSNPYDTDTDQCYATLSFQATATDNCDNELDIKYYIDETEITFPYQFATGTTTVKAEATDDNSNSSICTFNIIVEDNQLPTIDCPSNITVNNDPGLCSAIVDYELPTYTDNCAHTFEQISGLPPGSEFPVGTTTNTFKVTDAAGNTAECSFTITVIDNEAPTIVCPDNIVDVDCNNSTVYLPEPENSDNCGVTNIQWETQNGGTVNTGTGFLYQWDFEDGVTDITYTIYDAANNNNSCTYTVTINESSRNCSGKNIMSNYYFGDINGNPISNTTCTPGSTVTAYFWATFNGPNAYTVKIQYDLFINGLYDSTYDHDCFWEGENVQNGTFNLFPIIYTCGDVVEMKNIYVGWQNNINGNCGCSNPAQCSSDPEGGIIEGPLSVDFTYTPLCEEGDYYQKYVFQSLVTGGTAPYTYSWDFGEGAQPSTSTNEGPITVSYSSKGYKTVTLYVCDDNNVCDTREYEIFVDCCPPLIECPEDTIVNTDEGVCYAELTLSAINLNECVTNDILYYIGTTPITFPYQFPIGTTTVRAILEYGNYDPAECTFNVTVIDEEDPVIECPDNISEEGCSIQELGSITTLGYSDIQTEITLEQLIIAGGNASDNCEIESITYQDETEGTCPIVITRTFIVTDVSGNTATCEQIIEIDDNTPPEFDLPLPQDITVTCGLLPPQETLTASDNCENVTVTPSVDPYSEDLCNGYTVVYRDSP